MYHLVHRTSIPVRHFHHLHLQTSIFGAKSTLVYPKTSVVVKIQDTRPLVQ